MRFLSVTWDEVHKLSLMLASKVISSGFSPDVMVGVLRGGFIVARIVADIIPIEDLGVVEVKFYRGIEERAKRPIITQPLTLDVRGKEVLIVDDVVDSGRTLQIVTEQVRLRGAKEVRSAALFTKPKSIIHPDYYIVKTSKWIVFPWELGELAREYNLRGPQELKDFLEKIGMKISEDVVTLIGEMSCRCSAT